MKKVICLLLVACILFSGQSIIFASNIYSTHSTDEELYIENIMEIDEKDGYASYDIYYNSDERGVIQKDRDGNIVEVYVYNYNDDSVYLEKSGIKLENISKNSENSDLYGLRDCRYGGSIDITLEQICKAAGRTIAIGSLVGLILVLSGGTVLMTVNVVHEIRKALLSLALEWCPSNHGVIINYDRCWTKKCRGSDCYEGYFGIEIRSYSIY